MDYAFISQYYFTDWFMLVAIVIALAISLKIKKSPKISLLKIYLSCALISDCLVIYYDAKGLLIPSNEEKAAIVYNLFMIIESICVLGFIGLQLTNIKSRIAALFILILFLMFSLIIWTAFPTSFKKYSPPHFAIEGVCIVVGCLIYFYELVKIPNSANIRSEPTFWIAAGTLFSFGATIPFYLLIKYIRSSRPELMFLLNSSYFTLYSILYIFYIKAFICQVQAKA